jgi:hypothetical protein
MNTPSEEFTACVMFSDRVHLLGSSLWASVARVCGVAFMCCIVVRTSRGVLL